MESLFRLMLHRPPIPQDPDTPSIDLTQRSPFQQALLAAGRQDPPREALREVAQDFVGGDFFLGDPKDTPLANALAALALEFDKLQADPATNRESVVKAIEQTFKQPIDRIVATQDFDAARTRLRDSILAIKQLQEEHHRPIKELADQLRDLELIANVAAHDVFPESATVLLRHRRRSLNLPSLAKLRSILSTRALERRLQKEQQKVLEQRRKRAQRLFERYKRLRKGIEELTSLGPQHFYASEQAPKKPVSPPDRLQASVQSLQRAEYLERLTGLNLDHMEAALNPGRTDPFPAMDAAGANSATELADRVLNTQPVRAKGSPPFVPQPRGLPNFRLSEQGTNALSKDTQKLLEEQQLSPTEQALDGIVERLDAERSLVTQQLDALYQPEPRISIKRIGSTTVKILTQEHVPWTSVSGFDDEILTLPAPLPQRIPDTRGEVSPAGVADLLIVKQQLVGYERADVAHVENVLKGELKSREHTHHVETEDTTTLEVETTRSEENELESTDRYEMTREASATIKQDMELKAGLSITGSFGPLVSFSASAEVATSRSKEEATKAASTFSQDVTERSAIKISERVLERSTYRKTEEVTDRNVHELNNVDGEGHISGVYQWLNKVYQAQMYNYGLRTMYDFMVPEPAAYLMEAFASAHASASDLEEPPEFTLEPDDVTEANYGQWVHLYGSTDVEPPPEIYRTKSTQYAAGGGDTSTDYNHSEQITIDEGYRAIQGTVAVLRNDWDSDKLTVDLALGQRTNRYEVGDSWVWTTNLDDERDSVPFALNTNYVSDLGIAVEVKCQRTDRAMNAWRFETHAKLTTAYQARRADYEEKLAALELEAGVEIAGENPEQNLEVMRDELKKNCISIITDQHYDLFGAIQTSSVEGIPEIDVEEAQAEGAYVRFFENAMEWDNITWVTYPYFWGRKALWSQQIAYEDPDPAFQAFVRAGFCRVSVPVRPGFEGAIDHFLTYGELWNGGPLPTVSSPLFLPIADELAEQLDRPGDEVPQGEPWTVRVPTTLVQLRADDQLPSWMQDENGEWVEQSA